MEENTNVNLDDLQEVVVRETTDLPELPENYALLLGSKEYMEIIGTPEQRQEMFEAWQDS